MACGTPAIGLAHSGALDALCDGELGAVFEEADLLAGLQRACRDRRAGCLESGDTLARRVAERFGRTAFERRIGGLMAGVPD
jgi:hypothetical protein